jgi:transcriptional regulator
MFRRKLIDLLLERPYRIGELAELLEMKHTEVEGELGHLLRSIRRQGLRAVVEPASCRRCGFTFGKDKLHRPGRSPRCRGTWIDEPRIGLDRVG